jgi:hypothetical protein
LYEVLRADDDCLAGAVALGGSSFHDPTCPDGTASKAVTSGIIPPVRSFRVAFVTTGVGAGVAMGVPVGVSIDDREMTLDAPFTGVPRIRRHHSTRQFLPFLFLIRESQTSTQKAGKSLRLRRHSFGFTMS